MPKKVLFSLMTVVLALALVGIGAVATMSDTETSAGNTFTAATLDLTVDGENPLVSAAFNQDCFRPGNQPKHKYTLCNVGCLDGYLDLENITVTGYENVRTEPEIEAGDTTAGNPGAGKGELQDVVNLRLFIDYNCDGYISTGDVVFYNDVVGNLPGNFELDAPIGDGDCLCIVALFDWWNTADDNKAQTDSMVIDIEFELAQTTAQ